MACWKGKTLAPPTGTAKSESKTASAAKSPASVSLRVGLVL